MNESDFLYRYSDASKRITAAERLTLRSNPNDRRKVPSHHDHFELNYFLDGEIFFAFEGEKIDISPGDIVFIAPQHIHRSVMKTTCRYHRKHIKFTEDIFLTLEPNGLILRNLLTKRKIIKFSQNVVKELELDKLILEVENNLKKGTPYGDLSGTVSLFYLLNRIETYFEQSDPVETTKNSIVNKKAHEIISYIDTHLTSDLSYKAIADEFYMSEKNLYRFFKKETGFTLAKYVKERRIIRAKNILSEGGSATEAALASGFQDYSVFYRTFVQETGVTPSNFTR